MSTQQNFLVRYGLHHFVSCTRINGRITFLIKRTGSENLVRHAATLIRDFFGQAIKIKLV